MSTSAIDVFQDVAAEPVRPPRLTPTGYLRYAWRLLTSMRTALILLFLLALAAVPGSLFPQRAVNPIGVRDFFLDHPDSAPWLDRLSIFDVYGSPWFAATYLALFVSLLGCVLPRSWAHVRAMRARPPAAPRRLDRLPVSAQWVSPEPPAAAVGAAAELLRRRRYRVDVEADDEGGPAAGAEIGFLRETGNLIFHLSLLGVLLGVALGGLYGYKGTVLLVEGEGFVNAADSFDDFTSGGRFDAAALSPFQVKLTDFTARFETSGDKRGTAREFHAFLDVTDAHGDRRRADLGPNRPLDIGGSTLHLLGHGYAPRFVVRDATGAVVSDGPTPFLPQDGGFGSRGVVKVPDARGTQYGFQGFFTPTTAISADGFALSTFPDALDPAVSLVAYRGNLGLDSGVPQSVYQLDTTRLDVIARFILRPGESHALGDGKASITFAGFDRWANIQVSRDPGEALTLVSAAVLVFGLLLSLRIRRRRVWVRAATDPTGRTVVTAGGLARSDAAGFSEEFADLSRRLRAATGSPQEGSP